MSLLLQYKYKNLICNFMNYKGVKTEKKNGGVRMKAFHEVRTYESDFMVWSSSYEDISFLSHWHKEIEFIYVRSGQAQISVTDQSFTASAGDLVICDSGDIHYSDSFDMENVLEFIIFDTSIVSNMYESSCFLSPIVKKAELEQYGLFEKVDKLFADVSKELDRKEKYYQSIIRAKLREIWFLLKRNLPRGNAKKPSQSRRVEQLNDFQKLLSYMEEHYADNISLSFAAEKIGFSESHFSKMFKKMTGINFITYLNMVRVEQAAALLKSTSGKITDIALSCGFTNVRTFNRVFKEITGHTPSEFAGLEDVEAYNLASYSRKTSQKQYVNEDSKTVIKNRG